MIIYIVLYFSILQLRFYTLCRTDTLYFFFFKHTGLFVSRADEINKWTGKITFEQKLYNCTHVVTHLQLAPPQQQLRRAHTRTAAALRWRELPVYEWWTGDQYYEFHLHKPNERVYSYCAEQVMCEVEGKVTLNCPAASLYTAFKKITIQDCIHLTVAFPAKKLNTISCGGCLSAKRRIPITIRSFRKIS